MKRKAYLIGLLMFLLSLVSLTACGHKNSDTISRENPETSVADNQSAESSLVFPKAQSLDKEDKYRTYYEIFVYSFYDSDNDGIGDLKGVIQKLDYLNDGNPGEGNDLGITGIWLMPIMPSTTYHKYDVTDYYGIDEEYGTMEDFEELVKECDKRGINLIIDLVMNHTSSKHPWFTKACEYLLSLEEGQEPDPSACPYIEYYNFNKGMKWGWHQIGESDWYYEGGFWSEMPDLNLKNENVRKEFEDIAAFWLDKGVSGFRLDAVKEFISDDTEANVEILTWFNQAVKTINPNAYLVGEAWTSQPEYAKYYASGMDSLFDFAFAGEEGYITKFANGTYNALDLGEYIERENSRFAEVNSNYVNAPFYSNHDMDRAAGYYSGEDASGQAKMALTLNLTMSGNAFLYYGDEIGMCGSGKDENKRLAMRWTQDSGAEGTCIGPLDADKGIEQKNPSLVSQLEDNTSIYTRCRKVIELRNKYVSIRKGDTQEIKELSGKEYVTLLKSYNGERTVLIYNFSNREVEVDLSLANSDDSIKLSMDNLSDIIADEESLVVNGDIISLPAYSLIVFYMGEE